MGRDTRGPFHDKTVMLSLSVLDEAIVLDNVDAVVGQGQGNVSRFHLDRVMGDLPRGEDE